MQTFMCVIPVVYYIVIFAFQFINYNKWKWMLENVVFFYSTPQDFTKLRVQVYIIYH